MVVERFVNDKLEMIYEKEIMFYFKVPSHNFSGETEKTNNRIYDFLS